MAFVVTMAVVIVIVVVEMLWSVVAIDVFRYHCCVGAAGGFDVDVKGCSSGCGVVDLRVKVIMFSAVLVLKAMRDKNAVVAVAVAMAAKVLVTTVATAVMVVDGWGL